MSYARRAGQGAVSEEHPLAIRGAFKKPFTGGAKGVKVNGILLTPLPVTRENLNVIVDKGWITKAEVCAGVKPGTVKFCG